MDPNFSNYRRRCHFRGEETKALFVSVYNPIIDGNKPKSHPNVLIIFRFCRSPLPTESSEQRRTRFSPKPPKTRVLVIERFSPNCPLSRRHSPAPLPRRPSPCAASARAPACLTPALQYAAAQELRRPSSQVPAAARSGGGCRSRNTRCCLTRFWYTD